MVFDARATSPNLAVGPTTAAVWLLALPPNPRRRARSGLLRWPASNDWFEIFPNARFADLFAELYRVLKKNTHLYLFCDHQTAFVVKPIGEAAGFRFWKPLIWDKRKIGMGYHYRARYEMILFFEKGKRKLNDLSVPDILEADRIFRGYPTEKPVAVSRVLVSQSSRPGELVVDPFVGSGSTGVAAVELGRSFLGNDTCAEAIRVTRERLLAAGGRDHGPWRFAEQGCSAETYRVDYGHRWP